MDWHECFKILLDKYGLSSRLNDLAALGQEILRWNNIHNLTAYKDWPHIAMGLMADALLMVDYCTGDTCLDIGSGAGFPGLMLGLAKPEMRVTLLDGRRKRISFQQHACRLLRLPNVQSVWGRAGAKNDQLAGRKFHTVTCKALAGLEDALSLCAAYMQPGGAIILPRGSGDLPAIRELCRLESKRYFREYELPLLKSKRLLLVVG